MKTDTISTETAQRFYNWLGGKHDWGGRFERQAKERALALLDIASTQRLLNVGVGTGKEQRIIQQMLPADGQSFGVDLAMTMLKLTQKRVPQTQLCAANTEQLPFAANSFDRLLCTYVLDLIGTAVLPQLLAEFHRVLQTGSKMVLVSLTEGVNAPSKLVVGLWKTAYQIHPLTCGGCRPLQLTALVQQAGFVDVQREVVVQLGVPSEIITAGK